MVPACERGPGYLRAEVSVCFWLLPFIGGVCSAAGADQTRARLFSAQVETVGDKYMTVSGLPEPCTHHAKSICHLALDMLEIAGQVKVDDEPVQVCNPHPNANHSQSPGLPVLAPLAVEQEDVAERWMRRDG